MSSKFSKLGKAILAGLLRSKTKLHQNRKVIFKSLLKIVIVLFLLVFWTKLTAPVTYRVAEGALTYKLEQGLPGGQLEFSLGPAGMLKLKTHKTPINLHMDLVLNRNLTDNKSLARTWEDGVAKFKPDAIQAFYDFLFSLFQIFSFIIEFFSFFQGNINLTKTIFVYK